MFDATHLQNVQPTATVNVAEQVQFQAPIIKENPILKRLNIQTHERPVGALEMLWILELGISPLDRKFREAGLRA